MRNVFLAIAAILLVAIGWMLIETLRVYRAEPNITVNYRAEFRTIAEREASVEPGWGDEAWELLMEAVRITNRVNEDLVAKRLERSPEYYGPAAIDYTKMLYTSDRALEYQHEGLRRIAEAGVLDLLDQFVALAPGFPPTDDAGIIMFTDQPEIPWAYTLAHMRTVAMHVAAADGEVNEVLRALEHLLALGRTLANHPSLIQALIGRGIHSMALDELRMLVVEHSYDATICHRMIEVIHQYEMPSIEFVIQGDRAVSRDFVQRMFSDRKGEGRYIPHNEVAAPESVAKSLVLAFRSRFLTAKRSETAEHFEKWYTSHLQYAASGNPAERGAFAEPFDPDDLSFRHWITGMLLPSLTQTVHLDDVYRTEIEATRLMLMLEMYRARTGRFPEMLDELTTVGDVPSDPLHGGSFGYRLLNDHPDGRPYLLYSFGLDATDHGGREAEIPFRQSRVMTDRTMQGYDYIFNPPREKLEMLEY